MVVHWPIGPGLTAICAGLLEMPYAAASTIGRRMSMTECWSLSADGHSAVCRRRSPVSARAVDMAASTRNLCGHARCSSRRVGGRALPCFLSACSTGMLCRHPSPDSSVGVLRRHARSSAYGKNGNTSVAAPTVSLLRPSGCTGNFDGQARCPGPCRPSGLATDGDR